ncbi:MAG TPA: hypothetical protein VGE45_01200 [Chloroflexia bacterium]
MFRFTGRGDPVGRPDWVITQAWHALPTRATHRVAPTETLSLPLI